MIRITIIILLLIHGLIHIMGYMHERKPGSIKQFSGKTLFPLHPPFNKMAGIMWLISAVLLILSCIFFGFRVPYWWMLLMISILISQLLILIYWKDAKYGTILNISLLFAALVGYGNWKLDSLVREEVTDIIVRNPARQGLIINQGMFKGLPPCVIRWLDRSNITGKENIRNVRLTQEGEMLNKAGGKWMPFTSLQYFTVQRPAFIWKAKVEMFPGLFISARDKYNKGQGNMQIRLLSLYGIGNSSGREMDQGTLLRYLAESCWFPSAALSNYISWTPVDSLSARATMTYRGTTASGIFTFTSEGDVKSFEALRYGEFDGQYRQERWHIENTAYHEFQGIRIPSETTVTWKLKSGDFTWLKLKIKEVDYNFI